MKPTSYTANIFPFSSSNGAYQSVTRDSLNYKNNRTMIPYSKALFDALWTNAADGMRLTDENGIIVAANKAYCELVGIPEQELLDHPFTVVYASPEDQLRLFAAYQMVFQTGIAPTEFEQHLLYHSGKFCGYDIQSTFVDSLSGSRLLLTQVRTDGVQRQIELELRESEAKYRGFFVQSVQAMFECTPDGKILNANGSFLRLLGYSTFDEISNLNLSQDVYIDEDQRKDLLKILEVRGYLRNIEVQVKRKNGNVLTVLEHARALRDSSGAVIGIAGTMEDITAKKAEERKIEQYVQALEESKQKLSDLNAQKNKFLSILSHDLRSPFSSILGFCDILLKEHETLAAEERVEFIQYIQEAAQDQLNTMSNLLDWTRIESGRISNEIKNVDLHEVIRKSVNSLLGLAKQKELQLLNRVTTGIYTQGDPQLLQQLFTNLLTNALKFTPAGGGVFVELINEETESWTIAVRDTGVGIPEKDLPKLFKIDEKYSRKGLRGEKGTGLGLPLCFEIIQKHKGSINVQSTYGMGTTFSIQLPRISFETGKNILVVDDEPGVRTLHSKYIQRLCPEYNIVQASDGEEAYNLARTLQPVLILSDHDMPNVNGKDFVNQIKTDPVTQHIPVVIVTGHDSNAVHKDLIDHGVLDIVHKPVSQDQFETILAEVGIVHAG
jgi:PAS domain S-box-containing protein